MRIALFDVIRNLSSSIYTYEFSLEPDNFILDNRSKKYYYYIK